MQAGGYEYFVEQLRNAQRQAHNAIYVAQQLEKKVDELEALDELTTNQAKEYLARAEAAEADRDKWYGRCASLVWRVPSSVTAGEIQQWEADYKTELAKAEARVRELEAERQDLLGNIVGWQDGHREDQERIAKLRAALKSLQSDAQCTIDLYNKNGPTWTSRDSGAEYYDASYVIGSAEERIATIKAALADTKGTT